MTRAAGGNLLARSLATVSVAAQAADEIKSGKWEFTTQMQLPGAVQFAPSGRAAGGNAPMTRTACIDAANPIPAEAQCKVDQVDRTVSRSMLPAISPAVISHLAMPNSGVRRHAAALQSLVSAGARDRLARAEEPVVRRLCAGGNRIRTIGPA
jgi:hypothetical protein